MSSLGLTSSEVCLQPSRDCFRLHCACQDLTIGSREELATSRVRFFALQFLFVTYIFLQVHRFVREAKQLEPPGDLALSTWVAGH